MASRDGVERHLEGVVAGSLRRWLDKARDAVMAPWRQHRMQPDPSGVMQVAPAWRSEVDTILTEIGKISMGVWSEATDVPPVSRHAFVMSTLAQTENLLVGIPDEVYHLVFAELIDGINAGEDTEKLAARIDAVLSWTGSPNWPGRARNIAVTETTRAYGSGTLAAGIEQSRVTGRLLRKRWDTEHDVRVRRSHREVDGDVLDLWAPFMVGGFPLMFPGDPTGPADEVCGCRCDLVIVNEPTVQRG
jgi:Phage Mu protein F like protein